MSHKYAGRLCPGLSNVFKLYEISPKTTLSPLDVIEVYLAIHMGIRNRYEYTFQTEDGTSIKYNHIEENTLIRLMRLESAMVSTRQ